MRIRRVALPALLTATALAAPAGAQAASLAANAPKPCYGAGDSVPLFGGGFTPGGAVTVRQGQITLSPGPTADGAGNFSGNAVVQQPLGGNEETVPYTATDQANPALVAGTGPIRFSRLLLTGRKAGANGLIQRVRARGFTSGNKTLYAHVRRGGRNVKRLRLGRLKGACRTLKVRKRFFSAGANPGTYTLYFDTRRRYRKGTRQQLRGTLTVFRITRPAAAGAVATTSSSLSAVGSWR
jgi:hypothetical protein